MGRAAAHVTTQQIDSRAIRELAQFRYQVRRFLRFSENAARNAGLTPQQHQLTLGVAGFTGRGWANISELAEFLQERHNAVVELVNRASRAGLVRKETSRTDRRVVRVKLTPRGRSILKKLSSLHRNELERIRDRRQGELLPPIAKVVRER
jgi:DNA-binding MarR family transcriptional regulator